MITKLIIICLLTIFFFSNPLPKNKRGLKRKKLQEPIPVVFHLHNFIDSVGLYLNPVFKYIYFPFAFCAASFAFSSS